MGKIIASLNMFLLMGQFHLDNYGNPIKNFLNIYLWEN